MRTANENEHIRCFHYDRSEKPVIELIRFEEGSQGRVAIRTNEILFCLEGCMRLICTDFPNHEATKGHIIFLPAGGEYLYHALSTVEIIIFRIHNPIRLCDNLSMEKLYTSRKTEDNYRPHTRHYSVLNIIHPVWYFLGGVNDLLEDGVKCRNYMEIKIKEFFYLLRLYYSRDEIYDFFHLILSGDTAFSEYVRANWERFRNVADMAGSMNMSPRQFSAKFKAVFGQTASRWLIRGRANHICQQLTATDKPLKQIAMDNGFTTPAELTRFCKKELGGTPTEIRTYKMA